MDVTVIKTIAISATFILVFVLLPIVVLMLEHQRKMARLMRGESIDDSKTQLGLILGVKQTADTQALEDRIAALETQVADLQRAVIASESQPRIPLNLQ